MQFGQVPGSQSVQKNVYGPGTTGRPKGRKTAKPFFAPLASSVEMPEFLKTAKELMDTYGTSELPINLQSKQSRWRRSLVNKNISKGMTGNHYGR